MEDEVEEVGVRKQLNGARGTISPLTDNDFDGHGELQTRDNFARHICIGCLWRQTSTNQANFYFLDFCLTCITFFLWT